MHRLTVLVLVASFSCCAFRVSFFVTAHNKHHLPVGDTCAYAHRGGLLMTHRQATGHARKAPCSFADGTHATNNKDVWRCMHEANCHITDDWIQMAVFRDPRPTIVSLFYYLEVDRHWNLGDLEAFVARELPILCQWLAVRYTLFTGILAHQSVELWYNDAIVDPLGWHFHWFYSVGLQLPFHVVEAIAEAATADELGFDQKTIDAHPGEEPRDETVARRFEDEVSPEMLEFANDVLRTWLPPILLERFGVAP